MSQRRPSDKDPAGCTTKDSTLTTSLPASGKPTTTNPMLHHKIWLHSNASNKVMMSPAPPSPKVFTRRQWCRIPVVMPSTRITVPKSTIVTTPSTKPRQGFPNSPHTLPFASTTSNETFLSSAPARLGEATRASLDDPSAIPEHCHR